MGWGERDPPNSPLQAEGGGEEKEEEEEEEEEEEGQKEVRFACSVPSGGGGAIVTTQQRCCRRPSSRAPPLARPGQSTRLLGWGRRGRHSKFEFRKETGVILAAEPVVRQLTVFPENVMSTAPAKKLTNTHKAPENGTTVPKAPFFGAEGAVFRRRRRRFPAPKAPFSFQKKPL
eukprot:gene7394-biopygen22533